VRKGNNEGDDEDDEDNDGEEEDENQKHENAVALLASSEAMYQVQKILQHW